MKRFAFAMLLIAVAPSLRPHPRQFRKVPRRAARAPRRFPSRPDKKIKDPAEYKRLRGRRCSNRTLPPRSAA